MLPRVGSDVFARIRPATADDAPFLQRMLAMAVNWRTGPDPRPVAEVMAVPELKRYLAGWPRPGDVGLIAEEDVAIGAAWWRTFAGDDRGYGFVDEATPELSVAVLERWRRRGVGTRLLQGLIDEARRRAIPALSLSVETENPAARLYQRLGFTALRRERGSVTMVLRLG
jgi:GNAT superfamily N-acetyltransferase